MSDNKRPETVSSFLTHEELGRMPFKSIGKNVLISRFARFYTESRIEIGDGTRIDDFCILSGNISIGKNVHLSANCTLYGNAGITIGDYSGLSARCIVYSAIDDFSGEFMVGPLVPGQFRKLSSAPVLIERYVQAGAGCVIFPGLTLAEGAAVGALSLVNKNLEAWKIYAGIPARLIKSRSKKLLDFIV